MGRPLFSQAWDPGCTSDDLCEPITTQATGNAEWTLCTGGWAFTEHVKEDHSVVKGKLSQVDSAEKDRRLRLDYPETRDGQALAWGGQAHSCEVQF